MVSTTSNSTQDSKLSTRDLYRLFYRCERLANRVTCKDLTADETLTYQFDRFVETSHLRDESATLYWFNSDESYYIERYRRDTCAYNASLSLYWRDIQDSRRCAVCGCQADHLDNDTCAKCLILASQALINAADDLQVKIFEMSRGITFGHDDYFFYRDLNNAVSDHVWAMIELQNDYKIMLEHEESARKDNLMIVY